MRNATSLALPHCVRLILSHGAHTGLYRIEQVPESAAPEWYDWSRGSIVDHAYVLHYARGNLARRAYQDFQLRQLGLLGGVSYVVAYDKQEIDATVRSCIPLANRSVMSIEPNISIAQASQTVRLSASLKLYVALYDLVRRDYRAALVLEDDVQIHWELLPLLATSVLNASLAQPPLRVLFAGSYSPSGWDLLCCNSRNAEQVVRPQVQALSEEHIEEALIEDHGKVEPKRVGVRLGRAKHAIRGARVVE